MIPAPPSYCVLSDGSGFAPACVAGWQPGSGTDDGRSVPVTRIYLTSGQTIHAWGVAVDEVSAAMRFATVRR